MTTITPYADPLPPAANPLILNDAYFELTGVNLRCLTNHIEVAPENSTVSISTFCAETDYPGTTKWHLRATFQQSFDVGATFDTLQAALSNYRLTGTPATFSVRPYSSRQPSQNNPIISGTAIPAPFNLIIGDAGAASEVEIDWGIPQEPAVNRGIVAATGATAGMPGFFSPSGASVPANVAAMSGLTATPSSAWTTGQYVITADMLGAHWSGSAWVVGKA
jgi:hypothetical protein